MFDKYLIVEDSLRNTGPAEAPTGFELKVRLGYYRGLGLSMVEDLAVTVDGEAMPPETVRFDEGQGPITLREMETAFDRRWEFGAVATLGIVKPGGLTPGPHEITFGERLRISYLPFPLMASDAKTLEAA